MGFQEFQVPSTSSPGEFGFCCCIFPGLLSYDLQVTLCKFEVYSDDLMHKVG